MIDDGIGSKGQDHPTRGTRIGIADKGAAAGISEIYLGIIEGAVAAESELGIGAAQSDGRAAVGDGAGRYRPSRQQLECRAAIGRADHRATVEDEGGAGGNGAVN